jgi:hypothetical protein
MLPITILLLIGEIDLDKSKAKINVGKALSHPQYPNEY